MVGRWVVILLYDEAICKEEEKITIQNIISKVTISGQEDKRQKGGLSNAKL